MTMITQIRESKSKKEDKNIMTWEIESHDLVLGSGEEKGVFG